MKLFKANFIGLGFAVMLSVACAPRSSPGLLATPSGAAPTVGNPVSIPTASASVPTTCAPTRADAEGPFYKPNAPVRARVDQGHVLNGIVRSAAGCAPIVGARLEFWLADPNGEYDDNHRATIFSDSGGAYRFESNFPPPYAGRPSHIHIRASADGFQTLITQYYPPAKENAGTFDLVLVPVTY